MTDEQIAIQNLQTLIDYQRKEIAFYKSALKWIAEHPEVGNLSQCAEMRLQEQDPDYKEKK